MTDDGAPPPPPPRPATAPEEPSLPLIPLLREGEPITDPRVLATWYDALCNAVGVDVPHDLFALWLYPSRGGVELLGPEALKQDRLDVPLPDPCVTEEQAGALAGVVQRAGYGSVDCRPVRAGGRDVGLMLLADLRPDRYGARERSLLGAVAEALGPMLGRLARQWGQSEGESGLARAVTEAWTDARSPRDFFRLVSDALERLVPHDVLEVLVPGPGPGQQYRLGAHAGPPPWNDPALTLSRDRPDLVALFAGEAHLVLADAAADPRWPADLFADELPEGERLRSVLGRRVTASGRVAAHLLVGSTVADLYGDEDRATLEELARLLAPKIEAYALVSQLHCVRRELVTVRGAPAHLARIADTLATTPSFAEATRRLMDEVRAMLPCDRLSIAVRLREAERVVLFEPGERRSLADLPLVPLNGTPLGQVLRGEVGDAVREGRAESELVVPLRAGGRMLGALVLRARGFGALDRRDLVVAQQLADILAPHVELARRAAMLPGPAVSRRPASER